MKRAYIIDLTILAITCLHLILHIESLAVPYLVHATEAQSSWKLLVHQGFNTTFWWLEVGSPMFALLSASSILAFSLGIFIYQRNRAQDFEHLVSVISQSLMLPLLLIIIFNFDYPVITAVSQVVATTLAILALCRLNTYSTNAALSLLTIAAVLNLLLCSQLSPYLLSLLLLTAISLFNEGQKQLSRTTLIAVIGLLVFFLVWSLLIELHRPAIPEFAYPGTSRVVTDDGIAGFITPLIGENTILPFLDRMRLKEVLQYPVTIFTLLALVGLLFMANQKTAVWWLTALVTIGLFFDVCVGESFSTLAPIGTLRRITPGMFPIGFTTIAIGFSAALLWLLLSESTLRLLFIPLIFVMFSLTGVEQLPSASVLKDHEAVLASPSLAILKQEDIRILQRLSDRDKLKSISVLELNGNLSTSHRNKEKNLKALSDGRAESRWSPRRGAQYGDEWIEFHLPQPAKLAGIQLQLGKYFSDFPRGIAIESCRDKNYTTIRRIKDWQGGLALSAENYPYYTGQHDVTVLFPKDEEVTCLKISQIAESPNFDWSVAELRLLLAQ